MTDDTFYYLLLSLGANVFFFTCVWLQHRHIERECALSSTLTREVAFWQARYKEECRLWE